MISRDHLDEAAYQIMCKAGIEIPVHQGGDRGQSGISAKLHEANQLLAGHYRDELTRGGCAGADHLSQRGLSSEAIETFGLDHNVLAQEESWGAWVTDPSEGCTDCHRPITLDSPVFARKILIDPFDENGDAVYKTVSELTGISPP